MNKFPFQFLKRERAPQRQVPLLHPRNQDLLRGVFDD